MTPERLHQAPAIQHWASLVHDTDQVQSSCQPWNTELRGVAFQGKNRAGILQEEKALGKVKLIWKEISNESKNLRLSELTEPWKPLIKPILFIIFTVVTYTGNKIYHVPP